MLFSRLNRLFEPQASARNGKKQGGVFSRPCLTLRQGTIDVKLGFEKRQKKIFTTISCAFVSKSNPSLCLFPQKYGGIRIQAGSGVQDIVVNDCEFDHMFIVQSDSESFAKDFLIPVVQERLLNIKESYPTVRIEDNRFKMSMPGEVKGERELDAFIDIGLALIQRYNDW